MAEAAQVAAETAAMKASDKGAEAENAAMAELMIIDKDKNVGGTSANADAAANTNILNDQTTITGLMETMNPMTTGAGAVGNEAVADDDGTTDVDETEAYVQPVAARDFDIGRTLDTSDDMARLMLVHSYAGSQMVNVYNAATNPLSTTGTKAGYIGIDVTTTNDVTEENNVALKSEGMYYPAGGANGGDAGALNHEDEVAKDAKPKEVFSYVDPNDDEDTRKYAVLTCENKTDADTTYIYTDVDVLVNHDADSDTAETAVKARLPEATEYKHIHFGVWAALGEAAKSGSQKISDLGIGFVQNFSGEGLTSIGGGSDDMPNSGEATYNGNWVAAVQSDDPDGNGPINLDVGAARLTADFEESEITALLTGLATLSGDISGNEFSGTKASLITHDDLNATGTFTGSFSGGFYGTKAAEAGGIFDFTSEDAEDGAFRGAFGGDKQ